MRAAARHTSLGNVSVNIPGLATSPGGKAPGMPAGPEVMKMREAKRKALDEFSRHNNLKPESIKRAYRRLNVIDKKNSGVLDYTEFCEIMQVEPTKQSEDVFKGYDYNRSGLIDSKEFLLAMANFVGAGKDDKIKFCFSLFDVESTGRITYRELMKILKANHLAKTEAEVSRKAETIIAQCSHTHDAITFDEFVDVSRKFPNILFPSSNLKRW